MNNNIGKDFGLIARDEIKGKNYTIREKITVKMAPSGTFYSRNNEKSKESTFGHIWMGFKSKSIGWEMVDDTKENGPAKVLLLEPIILFIMRIIYGCKK